MFAITLFLCWSVDRNEWIYRKDLSAPKCTSTRVFQHALICLRASPHRKWKGRSFMTHSQNFPTYIRCDGVFNFATLLRFWEPSCVIMVDLDSNFAMEFLQMASNLGWDIFQVWGPIFVTWNCRTLFLCGGYGVSVSPLCSRLGSIRTWLCFSNFGWHAVFPEASVCKSHFYLIL